MADTPSNRVPRMSAAHPMLVLAVQGAFARVVWHGRSSSRLSARLRVRWRLGVAHVAALSAARMVEHPQGLAGLRILEALAGRLPASARSDIVRAITPAFEYRSDHDE